MQTACHLEIAIVIGLLVIGIVLFARETFSVDLVTLLLLLGLLFSGILTPAEAFAGFSSDIIIILASIFVISGALQATGILTVVGGWLARLSGASSLRRYAAITIVPSAMSAFMNNTTITAMFVPPVMGLARQSGVSPSQLLLPLAFASILGGTCTLIGTSTNVAVSGYIQSIGLRPLGMFEFTPIGVIIVGVGLAYMFFVGRWLIPDRATTDRTEDYELREFLSEITVEPDSPLISQDSFDSDLSLLSFRVIRLFRGDDSIEESVPIAVGDRILLEGRAENLPKIREIEGIVIGPDRSLGEIESEEMRVVEAVINPRSELVGQTLVGASFRERFGVAALAVYRRGRSLHESLGSMRLKTGDVLLLHGSSERVEALRLESQFSLLDAEPTVPALLRSGVLALAIFFVAIVTASAGWVALPTAFLAAAVAVVLLRCITIEKAYTVIDWRLLILIGGMTAFGTAMQNSGAAAFLADHVVAGLAPLGVHAILVGFFLLTILLTQPMSNAAAALVLLPVALEAARQVGGDERTFAIGIMLAASISFITPFEPSCLLVYGPGKYRFSDFVRVGGGLTLILSIVVLLVLPLFWPLLATK